MATAGQHGGGRKQQRLCGGRRGQRQPGRKAKAEDGGDRAAGDGGQRRLGRTIEAEDGGSCTTGDEGSGDRVAWLMRKTVAARPRGGGKRRRWLCGERPG
ncbi:Os02g0139150 [Oryza sativa Japonica Group]|uniref:Os02g0139150 protein n=1 Tax=Oryza sativa subsp. japonica TaxID=39947 RepID=A0A0P0VEJ7_ORYSJ|nr:Os02g0139150 [Oryza sativa Japonica Group]